MDRRRTADMNLFTEISREKYKAEDAKSKANSAASFEQWEEAVKIAEEAFKAAGEKLGKIETPDIREAASKFLVDTHKAYQASIYAIQDRLVETSKKETTVSGLLPIPVTRKAGMVKLAPKKQTDQKAAFLERQHLFKTLTSTTSSFLTDNGFQTAAANLMATVTPSTHPKRILFETLDKIAGEYKSSSLLDTTKNKIARVENYLKATEKKVHEIESRMKKNITDIQAHKSSDSQLEKDQLERETKLIESEAEILFKELASKTELLLDYIEKDSDLNKSEMDDEEERDIHQLMTSFEIRRNEAGAVYKQTGKDFQLVQDAAGYLATHTLGITGSSKGTDQHQDQQPRPPSAPPKHDPSH